MRSDDRWVYLDGNAVSRLWDRHTERHPDGRTGDSRDATPFRFTVLSDYTLDELLTIRIGNAYKKHLLFLMVFPDIPVLRSTEHLDLERARQDRSTLLRPPEYLSGGIASRAMALAGVPEAILDLTTDRLRKNAAIEASTAHAPSNYVAPRNRVPLEEAIDLAIAAGGLDPRGSATDFFALCQTLFTFDAARLIERPGFKRKGPTRLLNQQIDYYHLSYLPFIDGFVTDDLALHATAKTLSRRYSPQAEIFDVSAYLNRWVRDTLQAP